MDIMMPVMDGYEACKRIRAAEASTGKRAYIIGLTSNVYDSDREKCLDAGMDNYMAKPFDIENLSSLLKKEGYL